MSFRQGARQFFERRGAPLLALHATGNSGSNFTAAFTRFIQSNDFSVSMWFRSASVPAHGCIFDYFSSYNENIGGTGIGFGYGESDHSMESADGNYLNVLYNGVAWNTCGQIYDFSTWRHYSLTMKKNSGSGYKYYFNARMYLDGVKLLDTTKYMSCYIEQVRMLGYDIIGIDRYIGGSATCICMFDRQLSDSEVLSEYEKGMIIRNDLTGLSHYWDGQMDNNRIVDHVGNWNLSLNGDASVITVG